MTNDVDKVNPKKIHVFPIPSFFFTVFSAIEFSLLIVAIVAELLISRRNQRRSPKSRLSIYLCHCHYLRRNRWVKFFLSKSNWTGTKSQLKPSYTTVQMNCMIYIKELNVQVYIFRAFHTEQCCGSIRNVEAMQLIITKMVKRRSPFMVQKWSA